MLNAILALLFSFALAYSGINEQVVGENKEATPIEKKVVQTVKVEKEKKITKVKPKESLNKVEDKWEIYNVTAYTNGYESTQKRKGQKGYGIQANGERTVEGKSIACPKSLKFGTKVKIKEINNTYVCSDRGSKITEGHLDIFFEDLDRALEFGRQYLHVQIIKKEAE